MPMQPVVTVAGHPSPTSGKGSGPAPHANPVSPVPLRRADDVPYRPGVTDSSHNLLFAPLISSIYLADHIITLPSAGCQGTTKLCWCGPKSTRNMKQTNRRSLHLIPNLNCLRRRTQIHLALLTLEVISSIIGKSDIAILSRANNQPFHTFFIDIF